MADERQTVVVTAAAQDEILEKVSMAIKIRSLGQDIPCFFHQCGRWLAEVGYMYQADNS